MNNECEDCVLHFDGKGGVTRFFTETTLKTFLSRRNEWLTLDTDYKEYVAIARKTLERIPIDSSKLGDLFEKDRCYHVSCYQLFTNKTKIERAKKFIDSEEKTFDEQIVEPSHAEPPPRKLSRRIILQKEIPPTDQPQPSSSGILPRKCLICKKYGAIYVKDIKVGRFS